MKFNLLGTLLSATLLLTIYGCSSAPKSVEEFAKLSKEQLHEMYAQCQTKLKNKEFQNDLDTLKTISQNTNFLGWKHIGQISDEDINQYSKEFIECGRIYLAYEPYISQKAVKNSGSRLNKN